MMTLNEWSEVAQKVTRLWPKIDFNDDIETEWRVAFERYDPTEVITALGEHKRKSRFNPHIPDITKLIEPMRASDKAVNLAANREIADRAEQQLIDQGWEEDRRRFAQLPRGVAEEHKATELKTNRWTHWCKDKPVDDKLWMAIIVHTRLLRGLKASDPSSIHYPESKPLEATLGPVAGKQAMEPAKALFDGATGRGA